MKIRRALTGVLGNFLDSFTSRYSDFDGYWLFGLLVEEANSVSFDLLRPEGNRTSPILNSASRTARAKFAELLEKARVPAEFVSSAEVGLTKLMPPRNGMAGGRCRHGYRVVVSAEAVSDLGKRYVSKRVIFVAPHDPSVEHRSTRRISGDL